MLKYITLSSVKRLLKYQTDFLNVFMLSVFRWNIVNAVRYEESVKNICIIRVWP